MLLAFLVVALLGWGQPVSAAAAGTTTAVWAWGNNREGELGNELSGHLGQRATPAPALGAAFTDALIVAAGRRHTLLIKADGTAWAWGDNASGQLGNGSTTATAHPVPIAGLGGVVAVSGGAAHSLALKGDGTVWAWGDDTHGAVGDGAVDGMVLTPTPVGGLPTIRAVAAGASHSLALAADGTVWAWGDNNWGALGNDSGIVCCYKRGTALPVSGLSGVVAIAAGGSVSMALKADGTVWVWGSNTNGQLGDNFASKDYVGHPAPQQAPGLGGITAITAAYGHLHALKGDGTVWGWGDNGEAELGLGQASTGYCGCIATPTQTPGASGVVAISAGDFHTLALKADGTVLAWGRDAEDQTSVATGTNPVNHPTALVPVPIPGIANATAVAGGGLHSVVLRRFAVPSFGDVSAGSAYATPIGELAARGIIKGCDPAAGQFCPAAQTLRAQMAALIARSNGWDAEDHGNTFPDRNGVDDELWREVGTLAYRQIALGYADGTYNPTGPVLNVQVLLFISRAMVARGAWDQQPDDPALYPNLPAGSDKERADRRDVATYVHYVGSVPGTADPNQPWATATQPTTRAWFAGTLWQALSR